MARRLLRPLPPSTRPALADGGAALNDAVAPDTAEDPGADERLSRICQRPDGYHWVDVQGRQEFGPFDTLTDALADMDQPAEDSYDDADAADWAEQDLDIADKRDDADAGGFGE